MLERRSKGSLLAAEIVLLIGTILAMAYLVVPSHWTSVWGDREFTGWVAPIANRMSDGLVLYSDTGHSPMPPLSYVVLNLLSGGKAIWFTESLAIGVAQGLLVLTMYFGLSYCLPRPIPFLAAFMSIPVYYALPKTVFFDAFPQLFVAITAVAASWAHAVLSRNRNSAEDPKAHRGTRYARIAFLAALAAPCAIVILSKQSTGAGLLIGVLIAIAIVPDYDNSAQRTSSLILFLVLTALAVAICSILLSPWINVSGMFHDVFLTGSEPKGGLRTMLRHSVGYLIEIAQRFGMIIFFGAAILAAMGWSRRNAEIRLEPDASNPFDVGGIPVFYAIAFTGPAYLLLLTRLPVFARPHPLIEMTAIGPSATDFLGHAILWSGLFVCLFVSLRRSGPDATQASRERYDGNRLAAMFIVLFPAAFCHSFSIHVFRWTYDNNPLISVAIAGALLALMRVSGTLARSGRALVIASVVLASCACWGVFLAQLEACRACTVRWHDIPYLKHARLRPNAKSLHELVLAVQALAPDTENDQVLVLPNDPHLEEWINRPRPKLSCAVVFPDHYWDQYVESDFAKLMRNPPKVIVLGPTQGWRRFCETWNQNWGCTRLVDLVVKILLPSRYEGKARAKITQFGRKDTMDIYVRKDGAPGGNR